MTDKEMMQEVRESVDRIEIGNNTRSAIFSSLTQEKWKSHKPLRFAAVFLVLALVVMAAVPLLSNDNSTVIPTPEQPEQPEQQVNRTFALTAPAADGQVLEIQKGMQVEISTGHMNYSEHWVDPDAETVNGQAPFLDKSVIQDVPNKFTITGDDIKKVTLTTEYALRTPNPQNFAEAPSEFNYINEAEKAEIAKNPEYIQGKRYLAKIELNVSDYEFNGTEAEYPDYYEFCREMEQPVLDYGLILDKLQSGKYLELNYLLSDEFKLNGVDFLIGQTEEQKSRGVFDLALAETQNPPYFYSNWLTGDGELVIDNFPGTQEIVYIWNGNLLYIDDSYVDSDKNLYGMEEPDIIIITAEFDDGTTVTRKLKITLSPNGKFLAEEI